MMNSLNVKNLRNEIRKSRIWVRSFKIIKKRLGKATKRKEIISAVNQLHIGMRGDGFNTLISNERYGK